MVHTYTHKNGGQKIRVYFHAVRKLGSPSSEDFCAHRFSGDSCKQGYCFCTPLSKAKAKQDQIRITIILQDLYERLQNLCAISCSRPHWVRTVWWDILVHCYRTLSQDMFARRSWEFFLWNNRARLCSNKMRHTLVKNNCQTPLWGWCALEGSQVVTRHVEKHGLFQILAS